MIDFLGNTPQLHQLLQFLHRLTRTDKLIEGIETRNIEWLALGYTVSVTGCPAVSIPCGFTSDGLPVGIQIIALPHNEAALIVCRVD